MSRRSIFLLASVGVIAAAAASLFAPLLVATPPPVDADYIRDCLEPRAGLLLDDVQKTEIAPPIQIEIRTVRWNATHLSAFGGGKQVTGVVKDLKRLLSTAQADASTSISQYSLINLAKADSTFSSAIGMTRPASNNNDSEGVFCGAKFDGWAILRRDGKLRLETDFVLSDTVPWSQGTGFAEIGPQDIIRAKSSFVLNNQETGFIGGLRRKNQTSVTSRIPFPYLNRICFSREIELEEEYLILITPSVPDMERGVSR